MTQRPKAPLRVFCNTRWFEGRTFRGQPIESTVVEEGGGALSTLRLFLAARRCDAVVFNIDERRLLTFCLLRRLLGAGRCRLVSVDIHLLALRTASWRAPFLGWLLREVDLFVCYFKATQSLRRAYGLERQRFAYVPFKVNHFAALQTVEPRDDGYALVCGRERDYRTLAAATDGLDVPIVVLVPPDHARQRDVVEMPRSGNMRVEVHDGSGESWIEWISRARFIILPVLPDVVKPVGISTYLQAMALGKCVIISDSPSTQGLIDEGQAVIVPPGDPAALRDAIMRVTSDPDYRERVANAGKAYAWSLGDEGRLAEDIVQCVGALVDSTSLDATARLPNKGLSENLPDPRS